MYPRLRGLFELNGSQPYHLTGTGPILRIGSCSEITLIEFVEARERPAHSPRNVTVIGTAPRAPPETARRQTEHNGPDQTLADQRGRDCKIECDLRNDALFSVDTVRPLKTIANTAPKGRAASVSA